MENLTISNIEDLKAMLNDLPTATTQPLIRVTKDALGQLIPIEIKDQVAIVNEKTGELATIASKGYVVIQHKDAFTAAVDVVSSMRPGSKFRASLIEQGARAWLSIVFEDTVAKDGAEGILFGVRISNSFDKSMPLRFGGNQGKFKDTPEEGSIQFFAERVICSNKMTVSERIGDFTKLNVVDRANAAVGDIVSIKEKYAVDKLATREMSEVMSVKTTIRHYGKKTAINVDKLYDMILSLPLVAQRFEARIVAAKLISFSYAEARERLLEVGLCERIVDKVLVNYQSEEQNAWGLYNAATDYLSHTDKSSETSLDKKLQQVEALMVASPKKQ